MGLCSQGRTGRNNTGQPSDGPDGAVSREDILVRRRTGEAAGRAGRLRLARSLTFGSSAHEAAVENERENGEERAASGVARGQNQLHFVPEDAHAAAGVIQPLAERLDPGAGTTQMIVITNDVDAAAGIGSHLGPRLSEPRHLRLVSATHGRRALRVLRRAPAHILIATPEVLVELMQSAAVKLDEGRVAVLAWIDDLDSRGTEALEAVMTEVPKDAARIIIASGPMPGVEPIVERYARRARREEA